MPNYACTGESEGTLRDARNPERFFPLSLHDRISHWDRGGRCKTDHLAAKSLPHPALAERRHGLLACRFNSMRWMAVAMMTVSHAQRRRARHCRGGRWWRLRRPRGRRLRRPCRPHATTHSITSSARASSVGGTARPSALAVLMLTTRSKRVGCSTGKSDGFAPLRILSTNAAARPYISLMLGP